MEILQCAAAPKFDGYLLLGLWACAERVEARRAFQTLRAVQDAFQTTIPLSYFMAFCTNEEEALAMWNLHKDRVRYAKGEPMGA